MHLVSLTTLKWQFRDATARGAWLVAMVPGCVHTDLLRLGLIPDPFFGDNETALQWIEARDWEYRVTLQISSDVLAESSVELVAAGLDTVAIVRLNGEEVARTENMFIGYPWDVKSLLRAGRNDLTIHFASAAHYIRTHRRRHQPVEFNDPVGRSQVLRKQASQFGWDWGPRFVTAGIWRDLRLEAWTGNRLEGVGVTQNHADDGSVTLALVPELARPEPSAKMASVARMRPFGRDALSRRVEGRHAEVQPEPAPSVRNVGKHSAG